MIKIIIDDFCNQNTIIKTKNNYELYATINLLNKMRNIMK